MRANHDKVSLPFPGVLQDGLSREADQNVRACFVPGTNQFFSRCGDERLAGTFFFVDHRQRPPHAQNIHDMENAKPRSRRPWAGRRLGDYVL